MAWRPTTVAGYLAVVVLLLAITGCGGDDDGATTAAPEPGQPQGAPQRGSGGQSQEPSEEGTGKQDEGNGAEADIREAIDAVLTSGDPRLVCANFVTDRFVKETYGSRLSCVQAQVPESTADSVELESVEVGPGGTAKAKAVPRGGPSSGERLTISLVLEGEWRVDALRSNAPAGP